MIEGFETCENADELRFLEGQPGIDINDVVYAIEGQMVINGEDKKYVLIINTCTFAYYQKKLFHTKLKLENEIPISSIYVISSTKNGGVFLKCKEGNITIESPQSEEIQYQLLQYIVDIFPDDQMPRVSNIIESIPERTEYGFLRRLKYNIQSQELQIDDEIFDWVTDFVENEETTLDLGEIPAPPSCFKAIVQSLVDYTSIDTLVYPKTDDPSSFIKAFYNACIMLESVTGFIIKGTIDGRFPKLLKNLKNRSFESLEYLEINQPTLTVDEAKFAGLVIGQLKPSTVVINAGIQKKKVMDLMKLANTPEFKERINCLTINHAIDIPINGIITLLLNIQELDVSNCSLDLRNLLNALDTTPFTHIQSIDFSDNVSMKKLTSDSRFPRSLEKLVARNIKFSGRGIIPLIKIVAAHEPESGDFYLDLSGADMSEESWDAFFKTIRSLKSSSLQTLIWDSNPINEDLFCFIHYIRSLKTLSINNCSNMDPNLIAELVKTNRNITDLSMATTEQIPDFVEKVIEGLETNRSIKTLDITGQEITDQLLKELEDVLMKNRIIQKIVFGTNITAKFESFTHLVTAIKDRYRPIELTWPQDYFDQFIRQDQISHEEVAQLRVRWDALVEADLTKSVPKHSISRGHAIQPYYGLKKKTLDLDTSMRTSSSNLETDSTGGSNLDTTDFPILVPEMAMVSADDVLRNFIQTYNLSSLTARLESCIPQFFT